MSSEVGWRLEIRHESTNVWWGGREAPPLRIATDGMYSALRPKRKIITDWRRYLDSRGISECDKNAAM